MELLKWREREVMRLAPLLACGCATFVVCFVFVWFVVVLLQHRQTGAPGAGAYNTNYTASVILGFGVGTMWHYHYPNPKTKFQSQVPLARWPACVYITWPKTSLGFVPGGHWRPPESKLSNLSINTHMKPHQTKTNNTCLLGFFFKATATEVGNFEVASATCQNPGNHDLPFRSWSTPIPRGNSVVPATSPGDTPELNLPNVDFPRGRLQV